MQASDRLQIRLLGELHLTQADGRPVPLPASKKTRALLGYLITTERPHRRERLCDLLWDGPDDPRAELRWSLSKIRPLLNDDKVTRLVTDRERVGFDKVSTGVDLVAIRSLLADNIAAAATDTLKEAAGLFHGTFLDGLDLPICYRYQEWCIAERETISRLHRTVLATIVERLALSPEAALPHARALVSVDPLSESAHAMVIRLLAGLARTAEARDHYEHARHMLEAELGTPPSRVLEEARRAIAATRPSAKPDLVQGGGAQQRARGLSKGPNGNGPAPTTLRRTAADDRPLPLWGKNRTSAVAFVGRSTERTLIDSIVSATINRETSDVVLVTGAPGIGKSHLLARLGERMEAAGGAVFAARAFEAEVARPYGIWIDVLRVIAHQWPSEPLLRDLGLLLPEFGTPTGGLADRSRLFDTVTGLLRKVAAERAIAVTLDDVQWIDEASSALLHYAARHGDTPFGLLLACSARVGEIDDNVTASGVLRSLRRDGRLREIALAALNQDETAELMHTVDSALDPGQVFAESGGNPLFTLALAQAHGNGAAQAGRTIDHVIADQLAHLKERTRELLVWAAALERSFAADSLARVAGFDTPDLLAALHELERRGLIRPAGDAAYDFTHDLVRQAAYRAISQPRRRLVHRQIARILIEAAGAEPTLAGDAAHHAALGNDDDLAVRACTAAGERALRLFANAEARSFAERGLRHVERLPYGPAKLEASIALFKIRILAAAGPGMRRLPPVADQVVRITEEAEALGLQAAATTGHYLLSVLHQEAGDQHQAETSTLRAAEAGRTADQQTRARQLANTARCLLELETQVARARRLIREAGLIAGPLGTELCELHWADGLLQRWDGNEDAAIGSLGRALGLARRAEDRWREYKCLLWLAMLEFERGRYSETQARCAELTAVADRLGEEATPFVMILQTLANLPAADGTDASLNNALQQLRTVDDKSWLAYALNEVARFKLRNGDTSAVREHATEALSVASVMRRQNDIAIAEALLANIGENVDTAETERLTPMATDPDRLSARARAEMRATTGIVPAPTVIPTAREQI